MSSPVTRTVFKQNFKQSLSLAGTFKYLFITSDVALNSISDIKESPESPANPYVVHSVVLDMSGTRTTEFILFKTHIRVRSTLKVYSKMFLGQLFDELNEFRTKE